MLKRESPQVAAYLDRAAQARERACKAADAASRDFHEKMEASLLRMAASAAFVERVDLFLHTLKHKVPPSDLCPDCARTTQLTSITSTKDGDVHRFTCAFCGREHE